MNGTAVGPLWTIPDAGRALAAVLAERDRISDSLMTLEASATRQLLDSAGTATIRIGRELLSWAMATAVV